MNTKASLPDCPECKELEQKSVVRFRGDGTTMMGVNHFKDELGGHLHDPNQKRIDYSCNKGHKFTISYKEPCPNPKCDFNKTL